MLALISWPGKGDRNGQTNRSQWQMLVLISWPGKGDRNNRANWSHCSSGHSTCLLTCPNVLFVRAGIPLQMQVPRQVPSLAQGEASESEVGVIVIAFCLCCCRGCILFVLLSLLLLRFVCVVVVVAFCLCRCRCCYCILFVSLLLLHLFVWLLLSLLHFVCVVVVVAFCLCRCRCRCCYCILFVSLSCTCDTLQERTYTYRPIYACCVLVLTACMNIYIDICVLCVCADCVHACTDSNEQLGSAAQL